MPDKLTDKEIVKALECCNKYIIKRCIDCPLLKTDKLISCEKRLGVLSLDLINRLQAENEELKAKIDKLKLEMSYMSSPNTIGDRHEMGCW